MINPKNHRFLSTEGLFWRDGSEQEVASLLEGVLAATAHYSMLLWVDDQNKMLDNLHLKWGIMEKVKANNPIQVVAKFNGFTTEEIKEIRQSKKYLSGFDMT